VIARREAAEATATAKEHVELTSQLQEAIEKMSMENDSFTKLQHQSSRHVVSCDSTKPESDPTKASLPIFESSGEDVGEINKKRQIRCSKHFFVRFN